MTTMKWKAAASVAVAVLTATEAVGQGSTATDREALEVFYHATGGQNWRNNIGWLENPSLSRWHGVWVVNDDGSERVTQLNLLNNNLRGPIPVDLARLYYLAILDLSENDLFGAIPPELGQMERILALDFTGNNLSGTIPPELGEMDELDSLRLAGNNLSGTIPITLRRVRNLNLAGNNLSGTIPPELGREANANGWGILNLADNNLSGPIPPELGQLDEFETLNLTNNNLSGTIPRELGQMDELETLNLAGNNLSGTIPAELGQLGWVETLNLANNNLMGPIPAELGQIGLRCPGCSPRPDGLYLAGNNLSGPIPAELAQLTTLRELTLDTTTGLCLPADFPAASEEVPRRGFADLARDMGVPDCAAVVPTLPAKLRLSAAPAAAEGGPEVTVTAALDAPAPENGTTVTLSAGGTATLDTDYTLSSTTITIAEGETGGTAAITVIDDAEVDGGEIIVLDATSANPTLTAPPLTLTIEDNDVPVPALPVGGVLLLGALLLWRGAVRARIRGDR